MPRLIWVIARHTCRLIGFVVLWIINAYCHCWPFVRGWTFEPRHDKTNKMVVRAAKTQISLGTRPVWSEYSLSTWIKLGSLETHWEHSEDSDQHGHPAKTLIRLSGFPGWCESSLGAQPFGMFCHVAAQFYFYKTLFSTCKAVTVIEDIWFFLSATL